MSCCNGLDAQFDRAWVERENRMFRRRGLPRRSERLVRWLLAHDAVSGRTVLDVGAGLGGVHLALLAHGAAHVTDVDAAPAYLAAARRLAEAQGVAERVTYLAGTMADRAAQVARVDLALLDRVVCCDPDPDRLLRAVAERTETWIALVFPRSPAPLRWLAALLSAIRRPFGATFFFYIHPQHHLERVLADAGFAQRLWQRTGWLWRTAVYRRDQG